MLICRYYAWWYEDDDVPASIVVNLVDDSGDSGDVVYECWLCWYVDTMYGDIRMQLMLY